MRQGGGSRVGAKVRVGIVAGHFKSRQSHVSLQCCTQWLLEGANALQVDVAAIERRAAEISPMGHQAGHLHLLIPSKSCGISQGCSMARFMFVWLKWSQYNSVWACSGVVTTDL